MTEQLAALDGAVIHGGLIRVQPGLAGRAAHGADTRAAILALLLAAPGGLTEGEIKRQLGLSNGTAAGALCSLTEECPALCETWAKYGARIYLDRDEWRRTGWRAGGVGDRRYGIRVDRGTGPSWADSYLPTARVSWTNGRLRVAA